MTCKEIEDNVKSILASECGKRPSQINSCDTLGNDLGIDSFSMEFVILDLEREFSIDIPDREKNYWQRVNDIYEYIHSRFADSV